MKVCFTLVGLFTITSLFSCQQQESSKNSKEDLKVLDQIFEIIEKEWPAEVIQEFKNMDEEKAVVKHYRPGIGIWLRNNYLNKKSSKYHSHLVKFFNSNGIFIGEDISGIILTSFHRKLNGKPQKLDQQFEEYKKDMLEHAFEVEEQKK